MLHFVRSLAQERGFAGAFRCGSHHVAFEFRDLGLKIDVPKGRERCTGLNDRAVGDFDRGDVTVHLGENLGAVYRQEFPVRFHFKLVWENEAADQKSREQEHDQDRFGKSTRFHDPRPAADRTPEGHEEQTVMFQRVGQSDACVLFHQIDPLTERALQSAVLDLLHDQRTDRFLFVVLALFEVFFVLFPKWFNEWDHHHRLTVRLIDVGVHDFLDLGRKVRRVA